MKLNKIILTIISMSLFVSMVGCASKTTQMEEAKSEQAENTEPLTIGFIFVGSKDDAGYNQAAYEGSLAIEEVYGDEVNILRQENVPETEDAARAQEQMIQQGAELFFPTSYGHLDPTIEVANEHLDKFFFHQGGLKNTDNVATYFGTIWESFYLCGIAAGSVSETDKLGFVASFPIPQVLANINAFTLGAQSVNPNITTNVIFTSSWADPAAQTQAANTLIAEDVDVIAQHQDSSKTIIEIAEDNDVWAVGVHADCAELAPEKWLTGAIWNWGTLFVDMVDAYINDTLEGSIYAGKYRGGLKEGVVDIAQFGKNVPEDVQIIVNEAKDEIISGELVPFEGGFKLQDGSDLWEEGYIPTVDEIESMDYFVEGVIGTLE